MVLSLLFILSSCTQSFSNKDPIPENLIVRDEQTDQIAFYFQESNRFNKDTIPENLSITLQSMTFSALSTDFNLLLYSFDSVNGWEYKEAISLNENNNYTLSRGEELTKTIHLKDLQTELTEGRYRLTIDVDVEHTDDDNFKIGALFYVE